jgi:hypothetical protein
MMERMSWKREGAEWRLFRDRRIVGRVVPDAAYPGMWRVKLPGGLSDMVNLARAKDAARDQAIRRTSIAGMVQNSRKNPMKSRGIFGPIVTHSFKSQRGTFHGG